MPDNDIEEHAEEVVELLSDHADIDKDDVISRMRPLVEEYEVPISEARRSTLNSFMDDAGVESEDLMGGQGDPVLVNTIDEDEQWVNVVVKVVDLWEPRSDSISQVGLVGDESGRVKFVAFETSDLEKIEEGKSYELENVVTDEYQGDYSIKLNRTTTITEVEDDIEVGDSDVTVEGALVDLQAGSGLIKRCPEDGCTRVLNSSRCSEHGEVEGEFDLRLKAVLDNGTDVQDVIFNREATEEVTGIGMEEAKEMARDALKREVVAEQMKDIVVGRYYTITGPELGRYVLANEFEPAEVTVDAEATIVKVRSM
jgi:replication factor A1